MTSKVFFQQRYPLMQFLGQILQAFKLGNSLTGKYWKVTNQFLEWKMEANADKLKVINPLCFEKKKCPFAHIYI